ncbi:polyketide synthase [Fusarium mexicanum]|uniref:Polyketide synthase n=1 Tax=Fusarium mexicanum TaxID=751941 RepID=A0A8H5N7L2_9HYPO|nr:polyketide synthase [Fusarium mexicanum]
MDPQQRLFLMITYEALEDTCIPVETLRGSNTSVYASIFERSYDRMGHKDLSTIGRTHLNGTGESILSNRISYCFDLRGLCMTIDTGCSVSLVGLHQACHSLRLGESNLALVGGSQLVIQPDVLSIMSRMGMLNPDGKSYAFDSKGAGYGRGEGVATIVLKRLEDALKDGDRVHAIIANSGAALSLRVYQEAGLNPADTSFVEAHGTGTQAGDRQEIESTSKVFCEGSDRRDDLYLGSAKTTLATWKLLLLVSLNGSSAPTDGTTTVSFTPQLFLFSASTEKALLLTLENTKQCLKISSFIPPPIVASTSEELLEEFDHMIRPKRATSLAPLTFIFSGQGAQWHAMGRELINSSQCFRQSMMAMEDIIRREGGSWSLIDELLKTTSESRIGKAEISQPATIAIQIALVDLLESFPIRPSQVIGYSSGEVAAAYAAGALSRDNAVIVVACLNSPESSTISGDLAAIEELKSLLDAEGIFARKLKVDTAYHSHHMRRIVQHYQKAMQSVKSSDVRSGVTFCSSVTGTTKTTSFSADYWGDKLQEAIVTR